MLRYIAYCVILFSQNILVYINKLKLLYYDKQLNMRTLIRMSLEIYIIHVCKNEIYKNLLSIMTKIQK